jgi:hypothetical protein
MVRMSVATTTRLPTAHLKIQNMVYTRTPLSQVTRIVAFPLITEVTQMK